MSSALNLECIKELKPLPAAVMTNIYNRKSTTPSMNLILPHQHHRKSHLALASQRSSEAKIVTESLAMNNRRIFNIAHAPIPLKTRP